MSEFDSDWANIEQVCSKVDMDRLWRMHEEMAVFGAIPGPGVNRQAFSDEDIAARKKLIALLSPYDFEVFVDDIANIFIRRAGRNCDLPPLMTGSHMDSQPSGGRFDGIYGVLAGLEVLFALEDAELETDHPIEVVAWSNEEGSRFAPGAMGSMVYTGERNLESLLDVVDGNGISLREALPATLAATPDAQFRDFKTPAAAYIEAHIEQGPLLEEAEKIIGVVDGIQGTRWFSVDVKGESAHAGTTPVASRKDALQAAITIIGTLNNLVAKEPDDLRFTIGRFDVSPNTPNSVAERVSFSVDIRHPDATVVSNLGDAVLELCSVPVGGCDVKVIEKFNCPPTLFSAAIIQSVDKAAVNLRTSHMHITSGAFHDALFMTKVCPTGMIFVPCEGGVSHNPQENAKPEDLAAGTKVLLASLVAIDKLV